MTEPPRSLRLHICVIHHQMSREQSNISTFTDKTLAKKKKNILSLQAKVLHRHTRFKQQIKTCFFTWTKKSHDVTPKKK